MFVMGTVVGLRVCWTIGDTNMGSFHVGVSPALFWYDFDPHSALCLRESAIVHLGW